MEHSESDLVLEVLEGCAPFALREAQRIGRARVVSPTELRVSGAPIPAAQDLRRVASAYASLTVPARRPRELLETSVQQRIAALWEQIRTQKPRRRFTGVRLAAAGADTPDMQRIADALADLTGLPVADDGDLLARVRRGSGAETWEVLLRTTPRPLATRPWRAVDYPGAVNATIAASVLDLLEIGPDDALLDMTCGSGTFLIEQLHVGAPRRAVGIDISAEALDAAQQHQRAARQRGRIGWILGDAREVPLDPGFTRIVMNPPWGMLHGEHEGNAELYRGLLERAAEVAAPNARLGLLTQEVRRMRVILADEALPWRLSGEHMFFQKGHRPRLFLLERA